MTDFDFPASGVRPAAPDASGVRPAAPDASGVRPAAPDADDTDAETPFAAFGPDAGEDAQDAPEKKAAALKTRNRHLHSRFASERRLEEIVDWEWEPGAAYHVISMGDVDALSFLRFALRQQPLECCILSTWCMSRPDIAELRRWLELGRIGRLDTYVGEIFKGTYAPEWDHLVALHKAHGGRAAIFRNHTKTITGFGPKFAFVAEGSANVNTNPRAEQTVVTVDRGLALFYKEFFDGIVSFDRSFDGWAPYGPWLGATGEPPK
jgi:hypothetical protein